MAEQPRKPLPEAPPAPAGSLAEVLAEVPDPRQPYGWDPAHPPLPLAALLQLTVAATLCGARSLLAIAQWGRERREEEPAVLTDLGLPPGHSPCVATLHRVFKVLDVAAFERVLGAWLARTGVEPTEPIAVDGKTLRGVHGAGVPGVHLVAAYTHRAGAVLAQVRTGGKGHELAAAKAVLRQVPLAGRLVTGDALLTQRELCEQIAQAEGDYLLPVDQNQPALRADLERAFSPLAAERPGRPGPTDGDACDAAGPGGGGGPPERGDRPGAQGAPRAPRDADALGPG